MLYTALPCQAFERRPAQQALTGCAGLHNIKNSKALNIQPVLLCEVPVKVLF
jgi:hypothetical protein